MSNSLMNKNDWSQGSNGYIAVFDPTSNLPVGEMLKFDLNQLSSSTSKNNSSKERMMHSKILMADDKTNLTQSTFLNIVNTVGNKLISSNPAAAGYGDISSNYTSSLWEFYLSDETQIGEKKSFLTLNDAYAYLKTIAPNDGVKYTEDIYALIFDEIDNEIQPIQKINGVNMFYSSLNNGKKNGAKYLNVDNDIKWTYFNDWVSDLYNNTNIHSGHIYSSGDERIIKASTSYNQSFSGIHSSIAKDFYVNEKRFTFNNISGAISDNHLGFYIQDYTKSKYCVRNIEDQSSWFWIDWNNVKELSKSIFNPGYSVIACYVFTLGDESCILIKPVNIDTIYIDFYDSNLFDLYKVIKSRDKYQSIEKVDVPNIQQNQNFNVTRIPKLFFMNKLRNHNKFSVTYDIKNYFMFRNKLTGLISPISKMCIEFYSHPKRNNIIDIKII